MASIDQIDDRAITFQVPGRTGSLGAATRGGAGESASPVGGQIMASVLVAAQRDGGSPVEMKAVPGQDIVALHVEGGPVLYLHPATARDLLQGPASAQRGTANASVTVGTELPWPGPNDSTEGGAARGLGDVFRVVLKGVQLITGGAGAASTLAAAEVVRRADSQVDAGVYKLPASGTLPRLKGTGAKLTKVPAADGPQLVLIHGTFVETTSTFGKLWDQHPGVVEQLFRGYGGHVYALDHPTMGASPIDNAHTLVDALPDGARLHLLTHSRGGLVAEVLVRCAGQTSFSDDELALFNDGQHEAQRAAIVALNALMQKKKIVVERVVRVACPAHGTLLAGRRLDIYLSVLSWLLKAAHVPVLPEVMGFLGDVARKRADPALIPGLEAMIPGTPLVRWLNAAPAPVPGELRVIAGDIQAGGGLLGWVKGLLADAYYLTANDIVVHTGAMYGGASRAGGASFLLEQGTATTHFAYFANESTATAAARALLQSHPAGFAPIGPLSQAGEDWSGTRGAAAGTKGDEHPDRPALFVLPGILGSNLRTRGANGEKGKRIWLSARLLGNFDRLAYKADGDDIESDGPLNLCYDKLATYFESEHEVVRFGYDWRSPLEGQADDLAQLLKKALAVRKASGQPVRIIAHSMGGLLARTVELQDPDTWAQFMAQPKARFLMLGTPNGGSWAPMQVLSGDDSFGNTLAVAGSPFATAAARQLMAQMPGLLQLQADLLDSAHDLKTAKTWQRIADEDYAAEIQRNWWQRYAGEVMTSAWRWGVPTQPVLDAAVRLRERLDEQRRERLPQWASKMLLVVGRARATPEGFQVGDGGFAYIEADTGDGRVPLASALLPGVATWTLDCVHGDLSTRQDAFPAFAELLLNGSTTKLLPLPAQRGGSAAQDGRRTLRKPRRVAGAALPAPALEQAFGGGGEPSAAGQRRSTPQLRVTLLNGNLTFVSQPLLLGHYPSMQLTGTEAAINKHLGGTMSMALLAGLYPEAIGSHRIFHNSGREDDDPWSVPKPRAAIVVGLGAEGRLTAADLEATICQGVKAWAQRAAEEAAARGEAPAAEFALAATLVGSGGMGVSPGESARAVARGVMLANNQLAATRWPVAAHLTLVEQYLDRAGEAWRGLSVLAQGETATLSLDEAIQSGSSPKRRQPETGYRGADYDLIRATTQPDGKIDYALDSRRARAEVRGRQTQPELVRKLVAQAAKATAGDPGLGQTLFKLLVPLELKPFMAGRDRMVLQLDPGTAPIPWELLDTPPEGEFGQTNATRQTAEPWAIRTGMLRKLEMRAGSFRNAPRDARSDDAVLVIGEPHIGDNSYPPLPGARSEAQAVEQVFSGSAAGGATLLLDAPFDEIVNTLLRKPWRIVHIAGHGEPVRELAGNGTSGGVVLSDNVFLGPAEIEALEVVPELVFLNCCHLGGHDADNTLRLPRDLVGFAAAVADKLIAIGVRCVVVGGWAVDDDPAEVFARSFYSALVGGQRFVDAVTQARRAARARNTASKTWAAYQCYGDPNWVYTAQPADAQAATARRGDLTAIPSAVALALALENLTVDTDLDEAARPRAAEQLRAWEQAHAARWGAMGAVAEAFGAAWNATGDMARAAHWYGLAVQAADGSASLKAAETLANLRVRLALQRSRSGGQEPAALRQEIESALRQLDALVSLEATVERLSLRGSAYKRLGQLTQSDADFQAAHAAYAEAEALAAARQAPDLYYPAINRIGLELVLGFGRKTPAALDAAKTALARESIETQLTNAPDFWAHTTAVELRLAEALSAGQLAAMAPTLAKEWDDLHQRLPAAPKWKSVAEQADFVLGRYAAAASGAEADAARQLLTQLQRYAA